MTMTSAALLCFWAATAALSLAAAAPTGRTGDISQRTVLVWLYDCSDATLAALQPFRDSFTAISPSLYTVGLDDAGDATLSGDATGCVNAVHKALPGVAVWPWITSPDGIKNETTLMRRLFTHPAKFLARAQEEAKTLRLDGFNVDFEAPTEASNLNKTFWMETLQWADGFARGMQVPVSLDVMCTANVSSAALCGNFAPQFNASANLAMVTEMQASHVQRFVSMGTYGLTQDVVLNQLDWFQQNLPAKWGLGACPTCNPPGAETGEELRLRFGMAHAYGVREVDMFAFSSKYTAQWAAYWPYLKAFLQCGTLVEEGHCWLAA